MRQIQARLRFCQRKSVSLLFSLSRIFTRSGSPASAALRLLERRMVCAGVGAFIVGILSMAPPIFLVLLIDRAVAAKSTETIVTLLFLLAVFSIVGAALAWAVRQYLSASWLATAVPLSRLAASSAARDDVMKISKVFSTEAAWHAMGLSVVPMFAVFVWLIHPALLLVTALFALAAVIADWLGASLVSRAILVSSAAMATGISAYLTISDLMTIGGLVSVSLAVMRIINPIYVCAREWRMISEARASYLRLRSSPVLKAMPPDAVQNYEATKFAGFVVTLNAFAAVFVAIILITPMPQVISMPGKAVAEGQSKIIKAAFSGQVKAVHVLEGSHVEAGSKVIDLDTSEVSAQLGEVRRQIAIDESAIVKTRETKATRATLLGAQQSTVEKLVAKNVKPEAELIAVRLKIADLEATVDQQIYGLEGSLSRLMERRSELERAIRQSTLVAPVTGTVQALAGLGTGSNVTANDELLTIVPEALALVEARLDPADRGNILVGMKVEVKARTSRSRFGETMVGTVVNVSADQIEALKGYRVQIRTADRIETGSEIEALVVASNTTGGKWLMDVINATLRKTIR